MASGDQKSDQEREAKLQIEANKRFPFKTLDDIVLRSPGRQPLREVQQAEAQPVRRAPKVIREKAECAIHGRAEISTSSPTGIQASDPRTPNRGVSKEPTGNPSATARGREHAKKWRYLVSEDILQHVPSGRVFKGLSFYFDPVGVSGFVIKDKELPFASVGDVEFCRQNLGSKPDSNASNILSPEGALPKATVFDGEFQENVGHDDSTPKQREIGDGPESPYEYVFIKGAKVKRLKRCDP